MAEQQRAIETLEVSMIEPEVVMRIRTLASLGWGTRTIAAELEMSRTSVKRYLRGAAAGQQERPKARSLDADGEELARKLFLDVAEGNAVVVKDLLEAKGHDVSERTVQRIVAPVRRERKAADVATARYETAPGEQMQIDFGEKRVRINGNVVVIHLMAAVLGYSRRIFVKAFLAERAEDWREGIAEAFKRFGGVTRTLLVDNTRCLVLGRDVESRSITLHPGLIELCKDFGCGVRACAPYRARTKGKVENGVKYVKHNALAAREFASFAALEAHLTSWMERVDNRVHGTTNEVPNARFVAEARALRPLPSSSIRVRERRQTRRVGNDAFVDIDTVRYSVPHTLVKAKVEVHIGERRVRIYDGVKLVADHVRCNEPHTKVVDDAHHVGLWRASTASPTSTALIDMGRSLADYAAVLGGAP